MKQVILGNIWGQCVPTRLKANVFFLECKLSFHVHIDIPYRIASERNLRSGLFYKANFLRF